MASFTDQPDLWSLVRGTPSIDPRALSAAVELELRREPRDFRTRLLIRDALTALERRWGHDRVWASLASEVRDHASRLLAEPMGDAGFPTLERRMADATGPQTILQFLRELGDRVRTPARLDVGGSCALILAGLLSRGTDDIDAVDEVPSAVRVEHELLDGLATRYGLRLAHFQSRYLPAGWENRVKSLGVFGRLTVMLVDPIDIFVGKLFSKREKDRDDLRMLQAALVPAVVVERLRGATALLADENLRADAERNWYILFGETLPR